MGGLLSEVTISEIWPAVTETDSSVPMICFSVEAPAEMLTLRGYQADLTISSDSQLEIRILKNSICQGKNMVLML